MSHTQGNDLAASDFNDTTDAANPPTSPTPTENTDWIDEFLSQAFTDGASDTMWQNDRHVEIFATAKAAITKKLLESYYMGITIGKAAIEQKLTPTQLQSDRLIFKMLHKFANELIADYSNFEGRDNSATITGRYAMKIKDAVNSELQASKEGK